ncbi:hypothetical protein EDC02_4376 [Micromonospora sp. Llam0]|uniref:hypothetical protein n=1 Tax=Micromonospora sp. Llam0 TaxID=2485143 RepID=UPI000F94894C|nr:hypothetical protein [Micromonospora sp. Llam0]ROO62399.1 hypothetical protein EDC02_4376 [Micromonospora sp. Llam0]
MTPTALNRVSGAGLLVAMLAACGGDPAGPGAGGAGGPAGRDAPPAATSPAGDATPGAGTAADGPDFSEPCALLTRPELATVFDEVPEPTGTGYGVGFGECVWQDPAGQLVRLSVVPPENLQADYIDQLTARDGVTGLGAGSVTFLGTVGIGVAKRGGVTAAFTAADTGLLLAVKTGDGTDETADLIHVTLLGQRILSRSR